MVVAEAPPPKRSRFVRSKSLPAHDFGRRDSVQSSQSSTSGATGGGGSSLGGRDSGIGGELLDSHVCCACQRPSVASSCERAAEGSGRASDGKRDIEKTATIRLHYYPEGGWGWVICVCAVLVEVVSHGLQTAFGVFLVDILARYGQDKFLQAGCLGAMSMSVSLFVAPVVVAFCRRKSVRLTAVIGGLVTALGCLFTSFTTQFHQLFFSYGTVVGVGVGLCTITANLMVGQYFKRKREVVETGLQCATGLGLVVDSLLYTEAISALGWRLGLKTLAGIAFFTFFLGVLYRSASLYHPQRRAILHLKNQKRKVKDKGRMEERASFFDFTTLKSRTVQILLVSTALSALGINAPLLFLVYEARQQGLDSQSVVLLQAFFGAAIVLGSFAFGLVVVRNSSECRIARHYLCQAAGFMLSVTLLALTVIDEYHGFVFFAWVYGLFFGGYSYALKMFTYEKVRARNFSKTWSFVQWAQAVPVVVGTPITGYLNEHVGNRAGFYFSSLCAISGCLTLFLVDMHRRSLSRDKAKPSDGRRRTSSSGGDEKSVGRRSSLPEADHEETVSIVTHRRLSDLKRPELLTCISEEGLADIPDDILEELLALGDCMTSCDQVEHYLMLSEYENNLNKTNEVGGGLPKSGYGPIALEDCEQMRRSSGNRASSGRTGRAMTVIDEISTTL